MSSIGETLARIQEITARIRSIQNLVNGPPEAQRARTTEVPKSVSAADTAAGTPGAMRPATTAGPAAKAAGASSQAGRPNFDKLLEEAITTDSALGMGGADGGIQSLLGGGPAGGSLDAGTASKLQTYQNQLIQAIRDLAAKNKERESHPPEG